MRRSLIGLAQLLVARFMRSTQANLTITFAFSAIPIVFAVGAAADYGFAVKTRARMNAAADAAALSAVTPQMMSQTTTVAQTEAAAMFNSQVGALPRLNFNGLSVSPTCTNGSNGYRPPAGFSFCVQVTDGNVSNQRVRTAVVAYEGSSQTAFSSVIKMNTISIGGTSTATASTQPNIDFYLMLDTSPSMAIPATQDGINEMVKLTPAQDSKNGCAFACHETSPSKETMGTPASPIFGNPGCADDPLKRPPPCRDNYWLSQNPTDGTAKIQLRIDLVNLAVQNLVTTAQSTAATNGAVYQLAAYTFDDVVANPVPLQLPTAATKTQAQNGINMLVVDHENSDNGDQNTVFDSSTDTTAGAFPKLSAMMKGAYNGAGAGTGTTAAGDHPQQVLMIVTDGVADEPYGGSRIYKPLGGSTSLSAQTTDWCKTIKGTANVRIAVLYLVYTPLPMNGGSSWYAQKVSPEQSEISPTLSNCASPGLFYQVNVGDDISSALSNLFSLATKSARLSN